LAKKHTTNCAQQNDDNMTAVGVPIKILHEAEGHIITLETTIGIFTILKQNNLQNYNLGEVYRGKLNEAEDNMNCQMSDVTVTLRDGRTQTLDNVFIRGSQIRFLILPDMLKNAPMFKVLLIFKYLKPIIY